MIKYTYEDPTDKEVLEYNTTEEFLKYHPMYAAFFEGEKSGLHFVINLHVPDYPMSVEICHMPDEKYRKYKKCCENEQRGIRGGCTNCGDPCL